MNFHIYFDWEFDYCHFKFFNSRVSLSLLLLYSRRHRTESPSGAVFPPYLIHHNEFFPPTLPGGKCAFWAL
jgi:hypothetical protein